jgi:hypothetical protein
MVMNCAHFCSHLRHNLPPIPYGHHVIVTIISIFISLGPNNQAYHAYCCEMTKGHSELVRHHLLDCLLDAMYDSFMLPLYQ